MLVVDEIGKMELKSDQFANFISEIIGTSETGKCSFKVIIATVPIAKSIPIVERIKSLRNSRLYDEIKATVSELQTLKEEQLS